MTSCALLIILLIYIFYRAENTSLRKRSALKNPCILNLHIFENEDWMMIPNEDIVPTFFRFTYIRWGLNVEEIKLKRRNCPENLPVDFYDESSRENLFYFIGIDIFHYLRVIISPN